MKYKPLAQYTSIVSMHYNTGKTLWMSMSISIHCSWLRGEWVLFAIKKALKCKPSAQYTGVLSMHLILVKLPGGQSIHCSLLRGEWVLFATTQVTHPPLSLSLSLSLLSLSPKKKTQYVATPFTLHACAISTWHITRLVSLWACAYLVLLLNCLVFRRGECHWLDPFES